MKAVFIWNSARFLARVPFSLFPQSEIQQNSANKLLLLYQAIKCRSAKLAGLCICIQVEFLLYNFLYIIPPETSFSLYLVPNLVRMSVCLLSLGAIPQQTGSSPKTRFYFIFVLIHLFITFILTSMATRRRAAPSSFSTPPNGAVIYGYGDLPTSGGVVAASVKVEEEEVAVQKIMMDDNKMDDIDPNDKKRKHQQPYRTKLRVMAILFLINLAVILVFCYLRQPQRNLVKIRKVIQFLQPAQNMIGDDYVVFVTAGGRRKRSAAGRRQPNVQMGRSNITALDALQKAIHKFPIHQFLFSKWFRVDYIVGVHRLENFNYQLPFSPDFGDWFGISLNWDTADIVFLPDTVKANCFIDKAGYLRWERLVMWTHRHTNNNVKGGLMAEMVPDYGDDATYLELVDLFHTKSIFIDMSDIAAHHSSSVVAVPVIPLDYGHRSFYETVLTPHDLRHAAIDAGKYLMRTDDDPADGGGRGSSMVSYYQPRSDYVEYTSQSAELWHGHASALYSLALLHTTWADSRLLNFISKELDYFKKNHLKHCRLPNGNLELEGACLRDEQDDGTSYLANNAMLLLAMVEFYETTSSDAIFQDMIKIANFMEGSFLDQDKLFVQKIVFEHKGSVKLDTASKEVSAESQAAFSMARLVNMMHSKKLKFRTEWADIAFQTVEQLATTQNLKYGHSSRDFVPDPWLLQAINQIYKFHRHSEEMVKYAAQAVLFTTKYQIQKKPSGENNKRLDLWGSFLHDSSATASSILSHGLCSVFPMVQDKRLLFKSLDLSAKFQLQFQMRPETALWFQDPERMLGGMHEGAGLLDMSIVDSTQSILSFLCIAKLLE